MYIYYNSRKEVISMREITYMSNHSNLGDEFDEERFTDCSNCCNCEYYDTIFCVDCKSKTAYESDQDYMQFETAEEAEAWDSQFEMSPGEYVDFEHELGIY